MTIRPAETDDFAAIAAFITPITQNPDTHSLHCDEDVASNLGSIKQKYADNEGYFLIAFDDETQQMIGVFGGEMDVERRRIWAWGPFVDPTFNFQEVAGALYDRLLEDHATTLYQLWAFNDAKSATLRDFYNSKGFTENKGLIHVHRCSQVPPERVNNQHIMLGTEVDKEAVKVLHETAFPGTYFTVQEMIELSKDRFQLLVFKPKSEVKALAYLFAEIDGAGDGYIHFVAVDPAARGQGIGTQMLQQSLDWCFHEHKVPKVQLTVTDKNHARRMYEKAGFVLVYSGVGTKKEIEPKKEGLKG